MRASAAWRAALLLVIERRLRATSWLESCGFEGAGIPRRGTQSGSTVSFIFT
jgi:hypothetical protein